MKLFQKFINIEKKAVEAASIQEYKKEWGGEYRMSVGAKVFLSVISIATSYTYMNNMIAPLVSVAFLAYFFSVILLAIVEYASGTLAVKFWKFALRKHTTNAIILFFLYVPFAYLSLFLSTEGVREIGSDVADNTETITSTKETELATLIDTYTMRIDQQKEAIENEKNNPQGWSREGGSASVLTSAQGERIAQYQKNMNDLYSEMEAKKFELETKYEAKLTDNGTIAAESGNKYYNYVLILLLFHNIASFIISFMSIKIYSNDEQGKLLAEDFAKMKTEMQSSIIQTTLSLSNNMVAESIRALQAAELTPIMKHNVTQDNKQGKQEKTSTIGFMGRFASNKNDGKRQTGTQSVPTQSVTESVKGGTQSVKSGTESVNTLENSDKLNYLLSMVKECAFCGKPLLQKRIDHRFCSEQCRKEQWRLENPEKNLRY